MNKLNVLSIPARRMRETNPFTTLLADALEGEGVRVGDFAPRSYVRSYDAVLVHWPDNFASQGVFPLAAARTASLIALLAAQRLRGGRVVRIVHDLADPDERLGRRTLSVLVRTACDRLTTDLTFLSRSSAAAFAASGRQRAGQRSALLYHPRFADRLPAWQAVPDDAPIRFVGDLKPYKGLAAFLRDAAASGAANGLRLEIVGAASPAYASEVEAAIAAARRAGADVQWRRSRPSDEEMTALLSTARAVLLPYELGWNSGLALRALECGRPILCSDLPIFDELAEQVGSVWVRRIAAGRDVSADPAGEPGDADRQRLRAYLEGLSWDGLARGCLPLLTRPEPARTDAGARLDLSGTG